MSYKIAVVGATGNVGREILEVLHEKSFPATEIVALASRSSISKEASFGDFEVLKVQDIDNYDFTGTDIALFAISGELAKIYAPKAAKAGCVVIDNSSHFRMDEDVPLIVPEVNLDELKNYTKKNIIANPNCSTIQMVMALKPLHDLAKIKRIVVSTYQSVSGAGKSAMDELYNQTKGVYVFSKLPPENFTKQIAFNIIPQIDDFLKSGYTKEEQKIILETGKILDENIKVTATCVRVPVFVGHALSVNIEFEDELTVAAATKALKKFKGVKVVDDPENNSYITPVEVVKEDEVYVSRIRKDPTVEHGLNLWIVADNLRKGAALNAVQICEKLIELVGR
jgi:aspartate-semialdehyde dehydrogenase